MYQTSLLLSPPVASHTFTFGSIFSRIQADYVQVYKRVEYDKNLLSQIIQREIKDKHNKIYFLEFAI